MASTPTRPSSLGIRPGDALYDTETFGPLVGLGTFGSLDEALELANGHGYGLSAAIYTRDAATALRFRNGVSAGMLSINNSTSGAEAHLPFGGNGRSGNGSRQSGVWVLDQFTRWQAVNWDYSGRLQKAQMDVLELPHDPDVPPVSPFPKSAGVVIVGGGVMGVSVAFHLAEAGVPDVLLLDRGPFGAGSTSKAAGGVRAQFADELNVQLGVRSLQLLGDFIRRPGQDIDLHRVGYLFALTRPEDVVAFERAIETQHAYGVPSRLLDPQEAQRLSPLLNIDDVLAAAYSPDDGHCSPDSVVLGYATGARRLGATLLTGVDVQEVLVDGGEIRGVATDLGVVETELSHLLRWSLVS